MDRGSAVFLAKNIRAGMAAYGGKQRRLVVCLAGPLQSLPSVLLATRHIKTNNEQMVVWVP